MHRRFPALTKCRGAACLIVAAGFFHTGCGAPVYDEATLPVVDVHVISMRDEDLAGAVQPGYLADLVLLEANPLGDIRRTRQIVGVSVAGQWLDRAELDELKARALAAVERARD
jgi:hypothetical protein